MILLLTGCMTMDGFFFNGSAVDSYTLGHDVIPEENVEEVSFIGPDGNEIFGVWAHQDVDAPVLLFSHGNYANIDEYWDRVELYWSWGYETFIYDYRGFGKSKGSASHDGVLADALGAADYVSETTGLPPEETYYLGMSLGGFAAIHTSLERPPKVLITECMFASADYLSDFSLGTDSPPGWFFKDPFDNVAAAKALQVPYLIIHGEADDFIDFSNGEMVFAAANEPKRFFPVPGANHSTIPATDPEGYEQAIRCWTGTGTACDASMVPANP